MIIQCTVAARVASYLLPHSRIFADGAFEHAGIPGLRISGFKHRTIMLVHVPTNGALELVDCRPHTGKTLRRDLGLELQRHHAGHERNGGAIALWDEDRLDPIEEAVADSWRIRPATVLLSALMARNALFWRRSEHDTRVRAPRRSNSAARVEWKRGYSGDEIGELLTGPAVGIPSAICSPAETYIDPVMLRFGAAQIELEGPPAPRLRLRPRVRGEAHPAVGAGTGS